MQPLLKITKKSNVSEILLLKEAIRTLLREDFGGDYGGGFGDYGGYGMGSMGNYGIGGDQNLGKVFLDPFLDVGKTAAAAIEDVSSKSQALVKVILTGIVNNFLPFLEFTYDEIFDEEKTRAEAIKQKYAEVFKRNDEAFAGDFQGVAFMLAPAEYLAYNVVKRMPKVALNILDVLSGGNPTITNITSRLRKGLSNESLIRETSEGIENKLTKVLNNPKIIEIINNGSMAQQMKSDAKDLMNNSLNKIMDTSQKFSRISSLKDVNALMKKNILPKEYNNLQMPEKKALEKAALAQISKGTKSFFANKLQTQLKGIPQNNPLFSVFGKVIQKIKSL